MKLSVVSSDRLSQMDTPEKSVHTALAEKHRAASDRIRRTPPYIGFTAFERFIDNLKKIDVHDQIDSGSLGALSAQNRSALLSALRFLGLLDEHDRTCPELMALVNTTGDERGAELGHIIRNAYGFLRTGAVDLTRTTTGLLLEAVEAEGANRGTRVPAVTFLLKAAEKAGIEVSPRLRRRKYVRRPAVSASPVRRPAGSKGRSKLRSPYEVLMQEIYDPAKMKEGSAEERAVFTLARYLKSKKGKGSPGGAK